MPISPTNTVTENVVFGYAGGSDSPAYSKNLTTNVVSTYLGSVNYTGTTGSWPINNAHGDTVGVTDVNASFVANTPTDEYGRGAAPADRLGWLGAHYRFNIGGRQNLTRMGVRLYDPNLGRFLQVDPVEGGNANDYIYPADPVNMYDLDGNCGWGNPWKKCGKGHKGGTNIVSGAADKGREAVDKTQDVVAGAGRMVVGGVQAITAETRAVFAFAWKFLWFAYQMKNRLPLSPPGLPPFYPNPCNLRQDLTRCQEVA